MNPCLNFLYDKFLIFLFKTCHASILDEAHALQEIMPNNNSTHKLINNATLYSIVFDIPYGLVAQHQEAYRKARSKFKGTRLLKSGSRSTQCSSRRDKAKLEQELEVGQTTSQDRPNQAQRQPS